MKDIRLKEERFEFDGKAYRLRCNMNVLAEAQEAAGGDIMALLRSKASLKTALVFLAAMLNDSAEEQGWQERYTPAQAGRLLPARELGRVPVLVMGLVTDALSADEETEDPPPDPTTAPEERASTSPGT